MKHITAPMAGVVLAVRVREGDAVSPGQEIAVLESMKMEIPVQAEDGGTVRQVLVAEGAFVNQDEPLVALED